jgi:hypothetical protein
MMTYKEFISQVTCKVHDLELEYKKLYNKLLDKEEDIFVPIINVSIILVLK